MSQTPKEFFKQFTIIHAALLVGQLFFVVVAFYLKSSGMLLINAESLHQIFQIIIPLFVLAGFMGSMLLFKARIKEIKEKEKLNDKLDKYRTALIIKYALLEGPSLFAIVGYLLTADYLFLGLAGMMIIVFLIYRPAKFQMVIDLELSPEERVLLEDTL